MREQEQKITELREAKKIVLKHYDIILSNEQEELYYNALNALNKLINSEIDILRYLEDKANKPLKHR